jgi:enamine deaminase RidA (YjgF/YER057c/UK114 family)
LPGGINPSILLDSSPSPQLLLSENNVIVYANKCAARILHVKQAEEAPEDKELSNHGDLPFIPPECDVYEDDIEDDGFEKPSATGLEGHTIDQLNIDLADHEIRPFLSLLQVFENIKLKLSKREATMRGGDSSDRAEMYGEGPKYNSYDYYGDQEKSKQGQGAYADHCVRDTVLIVIEREDGKEIQATMYVALVDPYSTGYCYSSVSFIPGAVPEDATFAEQTTIEARTRRRRKRDMLRAKVQLDHAHHDEHHDEHQEATTTIVEEPLTDGGIGKSGENMIRRVARIKDRILDQMEYCFIALSPDGDIVITNAATKAILGQETLKASIGYATTVKTPHRLC